VHSGLPLRTAARRCPEAVFLPVDSGAYEAVSASVMATLHEFDAIVEVLGWDEAFLAVETDDPEAVARKIQARVLAATRLHCTVGIGENKLQAKLATGFGKPNGIFRLTSQNWFDVLGGRPMRSGGSGTRRHASSPSLGSRRSASLPRPITRNSPVASARRSGHG
jgi:DNA polymerase IV